jgi:hypothetical protein
LAYKPELPAGISLPEGHSIDTGAARYKELEQLATSQNWTQDAFSGVLGLEAKRVADAHASASASAPAPAPAAKVAFENMTTSQQFHHALAQLQAQPLR